MVYCQTEEKHYVQHLFEKPFQRLVEKKHKDLPERKILIHVLFINKKKCLGLKCNYDDIKVQGLNRCYVRNFCGTDVAWGTILVLHLKQTFVKWGACYIRLVES